MFNPLNYPMLPLFLLIVAFVTLTIAFTTDEERYHRSHRVALTVLSGAMVTLWLLIVIVLVEPDPYVTATPFPIFMLTVFPLWFAGLFHTDEFKTR